MEKYKIILENDAIKNKYCLDKNIPMVRVVYNKISDEQFINSTLQNEILDRI
jgi:hypothetical protein